MQVITLGKRLVPAEQIAFIEAFDPASNPEFKPDRDFKGRVVLLNRDTVLTEMTPQDFAAAHNMRLLAEDNVALGQAIAFRVETFTPTETFKPSKAYSAFRDVKLTNDSWSDKTPLPMTVGYLTVVPANKQLDEMFVPRRGGFG